MTFANTNEIIPSLFGILIFGNTISTNPPMVGTSTFIVTRATEICTFLSSSPLLLLLYLSIGLLELLSSTSTMVSSVSGIMMNDVG